MVQNFAFFTDRLGAAKNKNRGILNGRRKRLMVLHANDRRGCGLNVRRCKNKTTKVSLKG